MNDTGTECCSTCACFARLLPDGRILTADATEEGQPVCRRNTPGAKYTTVNQPSLKNGVPELDKINRPVMTLRQRLDIGYPPTSPEAVCYDGWRPVGTRPGARVSRGIAEDL